jgi:hypothetical protein
MNHTTLVLIAVLAAATLVIATTVAAAPAFGGGRHGKGANDGIKQKNKAKTTASGEGSTAISIQGNAAKGQ